MHGKGSLLIVGPIKHCLYGIGQSTVRLLQKVAQFVAIDHTRLVQRVCPSHQLLVMRARLLEQRSRVLQQLKP